MSLRRLLAGALLALPLLPGVARAWDFTLRGHELTLGVTNTTGYTYSFDNDPKRYDPEDPVAQAERLEKLHDDRLHRFFNKLDLSLDHGGLRVGTRLDLHLFANTPFAQHCGGASDPRWCQDREVRYRNQLAAERLYLMVTRPEFDLTLGDFYATLGKGIALSVIQLDEVGQDTTIRGGKLAVHHGELGFTFLAGTINALDLDQATGFDAPWRTEPLLGGRLEYTFFGKVLAGVHAVYINRDDHTGGTRTESETIVGAGLDLPDLLGGRLALSGEFDLQRTVDGGQVVRGPGRAAGLNGLAAYASATLQLGDLTLLGEFKYYDDFELIAFEEHPYRQVYHLPPTLERKKAEIKEGNSSVGGGHLRLDYAPGDLGPLTVLLFANYGLFVTWEEPTELLVHSPHGGLELSWGESTGQLQLSSGVRRLLDRETDELFHQEIFLEAALEQAMGHHGLELKALLLDRTTRRLQLDRWRELELSLTYSWSPRLTVAFTYERQEDPALVPWEPPAAGPPTPRPLNLFGGAVRYYLNGGTYLNLRVGESRAGIKCLNGICRQMPAFAGVEATAVVRY